MSTHRITDRTKIPFPCWLYVPTDTGYKGKPLSAYWFYAKNAGHGLLNAPTKPTHYSTNPPDQRPEDVVKTVTGQHFKHTLDGMGVSGTLSTAPEPLAIARAAAEEFCVYTKQADSTQERLTTIIASAMEQHTQSATAALRTENENLRAELDAINSGERVVLPKSKEHAKAMYSVAVHYMPELEQELTALRRDKERLIAATDKAADALEWVQMHDAAASTEIKTKVAKAIAAIDAATEGQP